jgi:hypothetical protein
MMDLRLRYLTGAIVLLCSLAGGGTSPKAVVAARLPASVPPPRIDGDLSDAAWRLAVPISHFDQFDPEEGAPATERTTVSVLFDDNALYFGVKCYDSDPSGIVEQLSRRDRTLQSDKCTITIDSYHDHTTAYMFSGTVSGIQSDGVLSHDGLAYDGQWDAVWEYDAKIVSDGWSAEFRIPFSALRFNPQDSEYVWGINFRRFIARKNETDLWVLVPRKEMAPGTISSVSKMGHLSGIINVHPPLHVEILPYQSSRMDYLAQPAPFSVRREFSASAGVDLKYGISNNATLDAAINPDFGQVEVDQAVLNLTVFETLYPEKRPFFLEGNSIFTFGNSFDNQPLNLFYSRRIGRTPTIPHPLPPGEHFVDDPQVTRILGAVKFTGRTEGGLSIGAISAVTRREEAVAEDTTGVRYPSVLTEPRAAYNVLRLKQEVLDHSSIGLMATEAAKEGRYPALSAGTDWNLRLSEDGFVCDGYFAGSQRTLSADQQMSGSTGKIGIAKTEGESFQAFSGYDFSTRNFSIDDLGFYSQPREHGGYTQVNLIDSKAAAPLRRLTLVAEGYYRWNWDGAPTTKMIELQPIFEFRNFWYSSLDYLYEIPAYDDASRGIVGLYRRPAAHHLTLFVQSDPSRSLLASLSVDYRSTAKQAGLLLISPSIYLRPSAWFELSPALNFGVIRNEEAWAIPYYAGDGKNLFGNRDIDETILSLRGTLTFTRTLSVQFFAQLFLVRGHYDHLRELATPSDFAEIASSSPIPNPDFNQKIINANVVLRWEYLRGSTFYFVWTQARAGYDSFYDRSVGESFADAFKLPMDNVILAKLTYWWGL